MRFTTYASPDKALFWGETWACEEGVGLIFVGLWRLEKDLSAAIFNHVKYKSAFKLK